MKSYQQEIDNHEEIEKKLRFENLNLSKIALKMKEDYKAMKKECKTAIKTYRLMKNETENLRTKNKNVTSELEVKNSILYDQNQDLEKITRLYKEITVCYIYILNKFVF